ncbi:NADH dehydrogenase [Actinotalea ferrariae CF5-4]|uniref:NADH-quinone oxidoreductase subunit n=1 Tax=Actinotalea ferrariae CF5-4 TaxID=948458 RepID=A0A021VWV9_9CELL|nr:NADH-quinone oxidoreductase subunit A [Actinotalea ferrariae]EYR64500.1 NADH dehydrogenase [Actinotalea ferrariae CF5-4]
MAAAASLLAAALALVAGLYGLRRAWSLAERSARSLPFESGSVPAQHAVSRHHVRWYAVTVLFLAFDMEMIFMYPWSVVVAGLGPGAVVEMFIFLLLLLVGVVYVWREGALRWA